MRDVSTFRLNVLRATYLLIAVGMGTQIWPGILHHSMDIEHMRGVVRSLIGAVTLLSLLGLRYPLAMLPLLIFELAWKTIWVVSFGFPLWSGHHLDAATAETWKACVLGLVIFPLVIPWGYVMERYVSEAGDRWRSAGAEPTSAVIPDRAR